MYDVHHIVQYRTHKVAVLAENGLVSSSLDSCNSLVGGLSCFNQHKLQSIHSTLACIVTNHRKYAYVAPILKLLIQPPVNYCCMYKTAIFVYKFLRSGSSYFGPSLSLNSCSYNTRHTSHVLLSTPHSSSQLNTLAIVLPLILLRFGLYFLIM